MHTSPKARAIENGKEVHAQDKDDENQCGSILEMSRLFDLGPSRGKDIDVVGQGHNLIKDGSRQMG